VDYADGLIRIGTQSAIIQPEAGALLRKLMTERGMPIPPPNRTIESVCLGGELCDDLAPETEAHDLESPELRDEEFQKKNNRRRNQQQQQPGALPPPQ